VEEINKKLKMVAKMAAYNFIDYNSGIYEPI